MLVKMNASSYNVGGAFQVDISQSFGSKQINLNGSNIGVTSPTGEYTYQGNFDSGDVGAQTWFFAVSDGFGHNDTGMVSFSVSGSPVTTAAPLAVTSPSTYVYQGATTPSGATATLVSNPINPGTPMSAGTGTGIPNTTNQTTTSVVPQIQSVGPIQSSGAINSTNVLPGPPAINPQIQTMIANSTNTTNTTASNTTGDTAVTSTTEVGTDFFSSTVSIGGTQVPVWEVAALAIVGLMLLK